MRRFTLLALLTLLLTADAAWAHRLEADAVLLPLGRVQVETWFETGEAPHGAHVAVYLPDGSRLLEGTASDKGVFSFAYHRTEPLRIVVNAGSGHRVEVAIDGAALRRNAVSTAAACLSWAPWLTVPLLVTTSPDEAIPIATARIERDRDRGSHWKNLIVGVSLLVGVAVLAQCWKSRRKSSPSPSQN